MVWKITKSTSAVRFVVLSEFSRFETEPANNILNHLCIYAKSAALPLTLSLSQDSLLFIHRNPAASLSASISLVVQKHRLETRPRPRNNSASSAWQRHRPVCVATLPYPCSNAAPSELVIFLTHCLVKPSSLSLSLSREVVLFQRLGNSFLSLSSSRPSLVALKSKHRLVRRTTLVITITASYFLLNADYGPKPNALDPV
ncbi:hypothetical protein PanWU01x14_087720 [Parasponia andersonii]|uniref:Uncharacterized protein n=1 Tax=Parasponia andersonii TaxID=3476 RepID=A0A2P5D8L5_PARAD|nr:hypothetical protein PanWU01x14_087720 [Parasponia andersonii]